MNFALGLLSESGNVISRLQGYETAAEQVADKDYWSSVGIISLTGILVVFLILAILIFFFWLLGMLFKTIDKKRAAKKAAAVEAKPVAPAAVAVTAEAEEEFDDEEEIVAVISAAVAAFAEADGTSYRIRSIEKRGDSRSRSAWNLAGINGNMQKF